MARLSNTQALSAAGRWLSLRDDPGAEGSWSIEELVHKLRNFECEVVPAWGRFFMRFADRYSLVPGEVKAPTGSGRSVPALRLNNEHEETLVTFSSDDHGLLRVWFHDRSDIAQMERSLMSLFATVEIYDGRVFLSVIEYHARNERAPYYGRVAVPEPPSLMKLVAEAATSTPLLACDKLLQQVDQIVAALPPTSSLRGAGELKKIREVSPLLHALVRARLIMKDD